MAEKNKADIRPKQLTSNHDRAMARRIRDHQWAFMDRFTKHRLVWVCWWNKNRHHDVEKAPEDLLICSLISGLELLEWMNSHKDWWIIGEWSDERYAAPIQLTDVGRTALAERDKYDLEPVTGGLVEPGWQAIPLLK